MAEVVSALTARDELDRTRPTSPLYAAPDAAFIDTTGKAIEDVVREVLGVIRKIYDVRFGDRRSIDKSRITKS